MSETAQSTEAQVSPFGSTAWTEQAPAETTAAASTEATSNEQTQTAAPEQTAQEQVITVPTEWLKNEFGVEDPAILKAEREEYKKLKETPPLAAEIKFENEQSKHLHELIREGKTKEVRQYLETQERLDQYTSAEVTDETASDIIKLGMKLKYKDLSDSEINYKYNKEFGLPKEPMYDENKETEEEFSERKEAWQERVNDIKMSRNIEAKFAKPELEAAKSKLVLPEITKAVPVANEPTEEQITNQKKAAENFLAKLESDYAKAEGFTTKVKDESVEIPVSFKIPDEAKSDIKGRLQNGFDINEFMDKRWFDENSNPKIEQIISDIYEMENREKVHSGIANNAANQRLVEYRKTASNIHVNGTTSQQTFTANQNGDSKVSPFSTNAWSEQPPSMINN